jgi:endonuclease III related protein
MAAACTVTQNVRPSALGCTALLPAILGHPPATVSPSLPPDGFQTPLSGTDYSSTLRTYFDTLFAVHGPQHWWPGRTRFEIIVGAILTQNTAWTNVERALQNLRCARLLSPAAIRRVRSAKLALLLRPSGYFRQKTKTLKSFVKFLYKAYDGSLHQLFATPTSILRAQLLALRGIGPETADSILLYAGKQPVFVVDAYTRRVLERHALSPAKAGYEEIRNLFETSLPVDHRLFNEFHALIVYVGKTFCRKTNPTCSHCPLSQFLPPVFEPVSIDRASPGRPSVENQPSRVTSH